MEEQLGKVTEWRDDRGFGFIEARDGGERIFSMCATTSLMVDAPSRASG